MGQSFEGPPPLLPSSESPSPSSCPDNTFLFPPSSFQFGNWCHQLQKVLPAKEEEKEEESNNGSYFSLELRVPPCLCSEFLLDPSGGGTLQFLRANCRLEDDHAVLWEGAVRPPPLLPDFQR